MNKQDMRDHFHSAAIGISKTFNWMGPIATTALVMSGVGALWGVGAVVLAGLVVGCGGFFIGIMGNGMASRPTTEEEDKVPGRIFSMVAAGSAIACLGTAAGMMATVAIASAGTLGGILAAATVYSTVKGQPVQFRKEASRLGAAVILAIAAAALAWPAAKVWNNLPDNPNSPPSDTTRNELFAPTGTKLAGHFPVFTMRGKQYVGQLTVHGSNSYTL